MKIYIVGDIIDIRNLSKKINKRLLLNIYELDNNLNKTNELIRNNKSWIILDSNLENYEVVAKQSNKIIILNYKNNIISFDKLDKYSRKIIYLKNKKEEKVLIKSLENGYEFML